MISFVGRRAPHPNHALLSAPQTPSGRRGEYCTKRRRYDPKYDLRFTLPAEQRARMHPEFVLAQARAEQEVSNARLLVLQRCADLRKELDAVYDRAYQRLHHSLDQYCEAIYAMRDAVLLDLLTKEVSYERSWSKHRPRQAQPGQGRSRSRPEVSGRDCG